MMPYHLVKKIAMGGMAEIYLATQLGMGPQPKKWCVKKILPLGSDDQDFLSMFQDEFTTASRLKHPNIVFTKELTTIDDMPAIVMEYIPGVDIRDILVGCERQRTRLPIPLAGYITLKIARGLDYVHKLKDDHGHLYKIVHRDISPQNILISLTGEIKIIDFGIADRNVKLNVTKAGIVKGKFSYMSPEQVLIKPIDHRTDQYALGIMFWEMLAMHKLFLGATEVETIDLVRSAKITKDLRELNPQVDQQLYEMIHKVLAKNIKQRFNSCAEFADQLETYLDNKYPKYPFVDKLAEFINQTLPKKKQKIQDLIDLADRSMPPLKTESTKISTVPRLSERKKVVRSLASSHQHHHSQSPPQLSFVDPKSTTAPESSAARTASSITINPGGGSAIDLTHYPAPPAASRPLSPLSTTGTTNSTPHPDTLSTYPATPAVDPPYKSKRHYTTKAKTFLLTSQQRKTVMALAAALILFAWIQRYTGNSRITSGTRHVQVQTVPKHLMVKVNNKLLKPQHITSPIRLSGKNLVEGSNIIEFSREGFKSKTIKLNYPLATSPKKHTVILTKQKQLSHIQLSVHPQSQINSVSFKLANNIDSGILKKGNPHTVHHLVSGQKYEVKFNGTHSFTCQLRTASSDNTTIKYQIHIEQHRCQIS